MTDPIIDRLDQIKGRADKAHPGPWKCWPEAGEVEVIDSDYNPVCSSVRPLEGWEALLPHRPEKIYRNNTEPTGEFIAAARTDVPALVDALIRVLERCDRAISFPTPDGEMRQAGIAMRETAEIIRDEIAVALGVETEGGEK